MNAVLLVTSLVGDLPPSTHRVDFDSWASCIAARDAVLQQHNRLIETMPHNTPHLTVVCIRR
jgi:hypothetical protein